MNKPRGCKPNCGKCCGIVLCNITEYRKIEAYAANHGVTPIRQGLMCPWYQCGKCQVYEVRPLMCRIFGHVKRMECPEPDVHLTRMSKGEEARKLSGYGNNEPLFLHEACYTFDEIKSILETVGVKMKPIP